MPAPAAGGLALFVNAAQVVTCAGPARARVGKEMGDAIVREGVGVLVDRGTGTVLEVGDEKSLRASHPKADLIDCGRGVLTPGFVDSHTHAIFGRARYEEQEMRASGVGYMEIARRGGGIHSSVADLRERSEEDLLLLARERIVRLASYGSTTIEVKSGYGLSLADEIKSLKVIARLAGELPVRLVPTWLGAHEIPHEFRTTTSGRREYIELLLEEMLP